MSPPRVGINLLWLVPGEVGGSEESTMASLRALTQIERGFDVQLFAGAELQQAHPDVVERFETTVAPVGRSRARRVVAESTWLARRTRGLELVHHAGGTAPAVRTAPFVLTVHDIQPLQQSATHGGLKRRYLSMAIPSSIAAARRVIVPSDYVRRSILDRFGTDPAKVVSVPHGVHVVEATAEAAVRQRYRLDGPVVLYPAITYPHKNHAVLVQAFAQVVVRHPDAVLVLTGGQGSEEARVLALADRLGVTERVRRPGRIPAADLAALYRLAAAVAVPSRYEGFGLPAAEAMAYGAPLVATDATALPEVVRDAGALVAPDDVEGWASAIGELLEDPGEQQRRRDAGLARSQAFTWESNARALAAVYEQAL